MTNCHGWCEKINYWFDFLQHYRTASSALYFSHQNNNECNLIIDVAEYFRVHSHARIKITSFSVQPAAWEYHPRIVIHFASQTAMAWLRLIVRQKIAAAQRFDIAKPTNRNQNQCKANEISHCMHIANSLNSVREPVLLFLRPVSIRASVFLSYAPPAAETVDSPFTNLYSTVIKNQCSSSRPRQDSPDSPTQFVLPPAWVLILIRLCFKSERQQPR